MLLILHEQYAEGGCCQAYGCCAELDKYNGQCDKRIACLPMKNNENDD